MNDKQKRIPQNSPGYAATKELRKFMQLIEIG
jgi:hypothetical protein